MYLHAILHAEARRIPPLRRAGPPYHPHPPSRLEVSSVRARNPDRRHPQTRTGPT